MQPIREFELSPRVLSSLYNAAPNVFWSLGGLHLAKTLDPEIERLANALHDKWKIDRVAPGHCTGEPAFAKLKQVFGDSYLYASLGSHVDIP